MRLVHLYANWKWTGPADPAVSLAAALAGRGHEVTFIPGRQVGDLENRIVTEARARGLTVREGLALDKHYRPLANRADRRRLSKWLAELRPDIVHVHTPNDHLVGGGAAKRAGIPIVRSLYDGEVPKNGWRTRRTFGGMTSLLLSASERVREGTVRRFGIDAAKTHRIEGAVDLARFDPEAELPDLREEYGIRKGDFVLGIVARMQRHRRFEVLFGALERLVDRLPNLRVLIVGRGTNMEEVAVDRARGGPLADRIVFTGYRAGDEYLATLRAMSVKVYLWPGSDGTCRAVREAMAMGVPIIGARVGMLDEIVTPDVDGLLIRNDPDALADAVAGLATDETRRRTLAEGARRTAVERFDLANQAARVEALYRALTR